MELFLIDAIPIYKRRLMAVMTDCLFFFRLFILLLKRLMRYRFEANYLTELANTLDGNQFFSANSFHFFLYSSIYSSTYGQGSQ